MERKFEDLKVSTRTIIATGNMEFNIENIFEKVPICGKTVEGGSCSIHTMYYKNKIRRQGGVVENVDISKQKTFRNALNVIMMVDDIKKVNFKISKNGKFQMTGCKNMEHAKIAALVFLEILMEHAPDSFVLCDEEFRLYFETVMTNVDCSAGYNINRQALDRIVNTTTPFHSLLETSFGYTGVNIKFPMQKNKYDLEVPVMQWKKGHPETLRKSNQPLGSLTVVKEGKPKFNTFLVFHSGQFIMSGMCEATMKDDYNRFLNILNSYQSEIREKLD